MRFAKLIETHKVCAELDEGMAATSMLQTLGNMLYYEEATPEDVAEILLALYDKKLGKLIKQFSDRG